MRIFHTTYGRVLSFAIVFSLMTVNIFSQQQAGFIRGQVVDANGAVIIGATVVVSNADAQRTISTDKQGQYVVNGLQPGTYTVVVSHEGFAPALNEVQLAAGAGSTLDLKLGIEL